MTWATYIVGCGSLAERFFRQGETARANYWLRCSGMTREWPKKHLRAQIDVPLIVKELERDEKLCDQMEAGEMELCLGHS